MTFHFITVTATPAPVKENVGAKIINMPVLNPALAVVREPAKVVSIHSGPISKLVNI